MPHLGPNRKINRDYDGSIGSEEKFLYLYPITKSIVFGRIAPHEERGPYRG